MIKATTEISANRIWLDRCKRLLEESLLARMVSGDFGTATFSIFIRDGVITEARLSNEKSIRTNGFAD